MTVPVRLVWFAVTAGLALAGCAPEPAERSGDPAVYRRISAATDCAALQREFDTAMDRIEQLPPASKKREVPMDYATTAMERMRELDCATD